MARLSRHEVDRVSLLKENLRSSLAHTRSLIEIHLKKLNYHTPESDAAPWTETIQILENAAQEIDRTLSTIDHLALEYKKSPFSKLVRPDGIFGAKVVLQQVISALREDGFLDHVFLIESLPSDLPPVPVTPVDLEEIFYNLIVHAAQDMIEQGGRLEIDASFQEHPLPRLVVLFRDTGFGIPEEALPYIFEPAVSHMTGENVAVSGLHAVKQLVEQNGGEVLVQSKYGFGTTFTLFFPVLTNQQTVV